MEDDDTLTGRPATLSEGSCALTINRCRWLATDALADAVIITPYVDGF